MQVQEFSSLSENNQVIKGGMIIASAQEEEVVRDFGRAFAGELDFSYARTPAYPGLVFVNIISAGVSKGKALEELASGLKM